MKLDPYFIPLTKINSKWIKDLNIRPEAIKLHREKNLLNIGLDNDSLDMTPKIHATKAEINKWKYIKIKSFCKAKKKFF